MPDKRQLHINGSAHNIKADPDRSLLSVLREELGMTGAKYGCGEGQCGACTVLLDGKPTRSCITRVGTVDKKQVTTIEGLETEGILHPVQAAFLEADAMQCGYCTPGMIMSAVGLLKRNANPSEAEIMSAMQGNMCRCGTYRRIVRAIQKAAQTQRRAQR